VIHSRIRTADGQLLVDPPLDRLQEWAADPTTMIWLDLESASRDEVNMVATTFNLVYLTVEDILTQGQRAKLEAFPENGYAVLVMHGLTFDERSGEVTVPELDVVLGKRFLITSHQANLAVMEDGRHTPEHQCMNIGKSPSYALYTVVDHLVDGYFPVLDTMDDAIEELEAQIVANPTREVLQRIFTLKRSLGLARKVTSPQLEVFNRLIARDEEFIDTKFTIYFRDVYDHLVRTFEVIDSYRDLMSSALDAYLSTVANRQNEIMKRLTVLASIFLPITFVTGVFGQNFRYMPQVEHDQGHLWWFALLGMALISAAQLIYYRYKDWF
jgi:magnesium transporter